MFPAVSGAGAAQQHVMRKHMLTKSQLFAACISLCLVGPIIAEDPFSNHCTEYRAQLKKLDCQSSFKAIATFLRENRGMVLNLSQKLSKERDSVAAFNMALEDSSQAIHNCLVKHGRDKNRTDFLINADVKFTTFHAGINYWARQTTVATGVEQILLRQHEEATKAVSVLASQW